MTVPIVEELLADVPRCLAAGSSAMKGDARLGRYTRSLRALSDSVPALARLADAVECVCRASTEEAATTSLDLLVLLRQARAGVMNGGVNGEFQEIPPSGPWRTPASAETVCAAMLSAIVTVLSGTKPPGHWRLLKKTHKTIRYWPHNLLRTSQTTRMRKHGKSRR